MNRQVFTISEADNLSLVGGKACALGKMIRAGFTIPNGFVLSAHAFMAMSAALQSSLLRHFDDLRADLVAVRSSALNEDGADAAWAGQLDTFLNCDRETLLQNIKRCWESANSVRAQSYARQRALQRTNVAVIVQEMIQSEVSGVAFSAHPVLGDTAQVVLEAGLGLGEAVVSGQITPDTYIINKKNGQIIETHVAQQKKKLVRSATGSTTWEDAGPKGSRRKLTDEQIAEVSKLTTGLETFFGHPVDVEWAISDEKVYILQSRPITTL